MVAILSLRSVRNDSARIGHEQYCKRYCRKGECWSFLWNIHEYYDDFYLYACGTLFFYPVGHKYNARRVRKRDAKLRAEMLEEPEGISS